MPNDNELLRYYIEHSDKRFDALDEKIEKLISFRWLLIGASMGISGVVSVGFQVVQFLSGNK